MDEDEARDHGGRMLCEDCYMDALSPTRTCDPWAVYAATSFEKHSGRAAVLTAIQEDILRTLDEAGPLTPAGLLAKMDGKLTEAQFQREFATLRHMEKIRAEKQGNQVLIRRR
jgi:hypothetical protein